MENVNLSEEISNENINENKAEINLTDSEKKVVIELNSEINQGLINIGVLELQKRELEFSVIQKKEKINQILQDKVSLSGYKNVKNVDIDFQNGKLNLTLNN